MDNEFSPKAYYDIFGYGIPGQFSSQEEADEAELQERGADYGESVDFYEWLTRDRGSEQRRADHILEARETIASTGLDIGEVSPEEVVALYRLTDDEIASTEAGAAWVHESLGLHRRLHCTLENLPIVDPNQATTIFAAFANSPLADDRERLADEFMATFTRYHDPDDGVELWDQLMRDPDERVRDAAERRFTEVLTTCRRDRRQRPGRGMHVVEQADDARLGENGLSREVAYRLMESYAYAENGQYHYDLGRVALRKLVVPAQPEQ